jgi:DNA-binding response OmpR family regulator
MSRQFRILVVEDDPAIRTGLVDTLKFGGYDPIATGDGNEGLELGLSAEFDLAILDVVLPGRSGFEILKELRKSRPRLPIILVTAKGAESDRVFGLQHGADDYVVKPFSAKELLARVMAVLRRSAERPLDVQVAEIDGRHIDFERREANLPGGTTVQFSEREGDILRYLVGNPGRVITRAELLERVWGFNPSGVHTRTVDMHVARLRDKLGDDPQSPRIIVTVRGKGYMLANPNLDGGLAP